MLLRSSSTPVLGSLLSSSFTDSPSNCSSSIHRPEACLFKNHHNLLPPTSPLHKHSSFHQTLSCTSSPISPSVADHQNKGFRRVQSEGNLEDLAHTSYNNNYEDRFSYTVDPPPPPHPKRYSARQRCLTLETIPSFSLSKHTGLREEEEDEESDFEDEEERKGYYYEFSTGLTKEEVKVNEDDRVCRMDFGDQEDVCGGGSSSKKEMMYLAKGLGVDGIGGWSGNRGGGGGGDYNSMGSRGNDGDNNNGVEEYYKKMVEENPSNPLFLRNYAQFLYQCKEDREGAEEYYSRAILADPKDGEVLSQYGKLIWELHHDQERASTYFERAVQASPQDSHVHAAYASFLWDTEEDNEEDTCSSTEPQCLPSHFHLGSMAATGS